MATHEKEALNQQPQSPMPGDESEIGRDRGLSRIVHVGSYTATISVTKERAASDGQIGLRICMRLAR